MHLSLCPLLTIIVQQESSIPWKSSPPGKQWKTKSSWIYKVTWQKPGEKNQQNYKENICKFTVWAVVDLLSCSSHRRHPPPLPFFSVFRDNIWPHNSCDIKSMLFTFSHLMSSHTLPSSLYLLDFSTNMI